MVNLNEVIERPLVGTTTNEALDETMPYVPDLTLDVADARIIHTIPAAVDEQKALHYLRVPSHADRNKHVDRHLEQIRAAKVEATRLARPRAVYRTLAVDRFDAEGVTLQGGHRFSGGKIARLLKGAERVIVGVATLGPAVDDEVRRLLDEKLYVEWYSLNAVGGAMVNEYWFRVATALRHRAARDGWQALPPLGPGFKYWSLLDQAVVFDIVPADRIGVALTEHCVMVPYKTKSLVIGIGHDLPRRSSREIESSSTEC